MLKFVSNKGGGEPVNIESAILSGYAPDGGLYVPEKLPKISEESLKKWKDLSFKDLAFEITSLFIDRRLVPAKDLKSIITKAYGSFEKEEVIPIRKLKTRKDTFVMELFYGSTLSFKDVGLSFVVNLIDFFLKRKKTRKSIIVATTGDTGPAAASYIANTETMDAWVLYPKGMITDEQERQMTTLQEDNVHPVGVFNCVDGADDLDLVISKLYDNKDFKDRVNLSSVNSINWGRVMIQTAHYFYAYFKVADRIGDDVNMVVPSGAFGNLCAGGLARKMGLPINQFIIANNRNSCLMRIFTEGIFSKEPIIETISSAIDILIPLNFWRFLYFCVDQNGEQIKAWNEEFTTNGIIRFDQKTFESYSKGFLAMSVSDEETIDSIRSVFHEEDYLLDPHTAVAVAVRDRLNIKARGLKTVCLATAHPAKFPEIILKALDLQDLPNAARHPTIEKSKHQCQKGYTVDLADLENALIEVMDKHWKRKKNIF